MTTLLAAIDLEDTPSALQVLAKAKTMAHNSGASLHVVHVVPSISLAFSAAMSLGVITDEAAEIARENANAARQLLLDLVGADIAPEHCHVVEGKGAEKIYQQAGQLGADTVVVGSKTAGILALGSVTHRLLTLAKFDVMVVNIV
ncbi:hypothetical protein SIN8267_01351 [Sinobacterium norvegicum]|uniref:UspA domain-containing protein n=1 Tax=Sinobacterium norvegicum TaxID=1641715 RepID=A0ABN8EGZ8_9GAMM|nr:universal stress protein [Sinobacterium norvegicum]CAH0991249.1 hypothetical protein SIN8267_01351 [Sinobacterium norvegicum]